MEAMTPKCAAKYCRQPAVASSKYCERHANMTGGQVMAEMNTASPYTMTNKQAQRLIDYALDRLMME